MIERADILTALLAAGRDAIGAEVDSRPGGKAEIEIQEKTDRLRRLVAGSCESFEIDLGRFTRSPIELLVWVPDLHFVASAVRSGDRNLVVLSGGLEGLIDILSSMMALHGGLTALGVDTSETNLLFGQVLAAQAGPRAAPALPLRKKLPPELARYSVLLHSVVRLFVVLHEFGHVQLGHLERTGVELAVHHELLVAERTSPEMMQEYEADEFALSLADGWAQQVLGLGARLFFLLMSLVESASGPGRPLSHPYAGNRIGHLVQRFPGAGSNEMDELFGMIRKVHDQWSESGRSFAGKLFAKMRTATPDSLTDEMVAMLSLSLLVERLASLLEDHPEATAPLDPLIRR